MSTEQHGRPNAVSIFHVNLNCADLDRTTAFYELVGFREVNALADTRSFAEIGLSPLLRVPEGCSARARLMMLGDDERATRLDLIEWTEPRTRGTMPRDLTHMGVNRICLRVRDAFEMHDRLTAAGHEAFTPPALIDMGGTRQYIFCVADPDGMAIEFMQFVRE
jgi:glyoxylase I family protein